jgi:dipeptidyl aminopeptidase/acylaminoacyl peptidase
MTMTGYGAWRSPITADQVARAEVRLAAVQFGPDGALWWAEGRPSEGGRSVVVRRDPQTGEVRDLLPGGWNARTRVHEYGGGAWLPVGGTTFVFANWADQRLYLCPDDDRPPAPLTAEPAEPQGDRYADMVLAPGGGEIWCVRERATGPTTVQRDLVAVSLTPVREPAEPRVLAVDGHFLSNLRPSPDGRRACWLTWEHPRMPWDGTELRVADVTADGTFATARTVAGGPAESLFQPEWAGPDRLTVVSDRSGWWNLLEIGLDGCVRELCPRPEEFGEPQWIFGMSTYARLADGRIAAAHGRGRRVLSLLDPDSGELSTPDLPYTDWDPFVVASGGTVAGVAGSGTSVAAVVVFDAVTGTSSTVGSPGPPLPPEGYLPRPREEVFTGVGGREVHAIVYPPRNPDHEGPAGESPPYVAFVHGGPTGQVRARLDLEIAFFTSRGIGVVDVNYGGSTGYGREYRQRLQGQWGIVDVEDVVSVLEALADRGEADRARLFIRGGSAGGWTVLAAVTSTKVFAGGVSYYGVAELVSMAQDTHDFESRYLDGLVGGPLPEARELWEQRSPLSHADDTACPVLLLQGLEDRVVPPAQAECFRDALARRGIPHAYIAFPGEQHGFRRAENIVTALEAELSFYGQLGGFDPPGIPVLALQG